MKKLLIVLALTSVSAGGALAAGKPAPAKAAPAAEAAPEASGGDVDPDKGDGCGLGWQITKKRTFLATTTRGTTNAFIPPTFGMSSGTIDCEQHSFAKREQKSLQFAYANVQSLSMDMAAGGGEYLTALARSMGCSESAVGAFGTTMQRDLPQILGNSRNGAEFYIEIKNSAKGSPSLAAACSNLG